MCAHIPKGDCGIATCVQKGAFLMTSGCSCLPSFIFQRPSVASIAQRFPDTKSQLTRDQLRTPRTQNYRKTSLKGVIVIALLRKRLADRKGPVEVKAGKGSSQE